MEINHREDCPVVTAQAAFRRGNYNLIDEELPYSEVVGRLQTAAQQECSQTLFIEAPIMGSGLL